MSSTIKCVRQIAFVALVQCSVTLSAHAQNEPAVPCNEAGEPIRIHYGEHTTGCGIGTPTDADRFIFGGVAGETVWFGLRSNQNYLDPRIVVRDLSQAMAPVVLTSSCGGDCFPSGCWCSTFPTLLLPSTGLYQITIDDLNGDDSGSYLFELERVPSPTAPTIPLGVATRVVIDHSTDVDQFSFDAFAGMQVRIRARSLTNYLDPRVQLFGPTGLVNMSDTSCNGDCFPSGCTCTFERELTLQAPGTYTIVAWDDGIDDAGQFDLTVECVVGSCGYIPPNDSCADAALVGNGRRFFSTRGASTDGIPDAVFGDIQHDIWYRWQAPCTAVLTVSTLGDAGYDTKIAIYNDGDCDGLDHMLACNDDFLPVAWGSDSLVRTRVTAGNTYLIRIGSGADVTGAGEITVSCGWPADVNHDNFVNSQDFFDFISCFFSDTCEMDYNHDRFENSQDYFDFLCDFFANGWCG